MILGQVELAFWQVCNRRCRHTLGTYWRPDLRVQMSFLARDDQIVRLRVPASGRSTGRKGWQCTTRYELEGKDSSDQSLEAWFDEQNRQWGQKIGEGADSSPGTENRLERQLSTLRTRLAGLHLSGKEASVRGLGCARPNRPDPAPDYCEISQPQSCTRR